MKILTEHRGLEAITGADLLKMMEFPAGGEAIKTLVAQVKSAAMLLLVSQECFQAGFTLPQIEETLKSLIAFEAEAQHRCAACFEWIDRGYLHTGVVEDRYTFVVVCTNCMQKLDQGQVTNEMLNNFNSYRG